MIEVTTHEAKAHLSRLLKQVEKGETVIILSGRTPVAKLSAIHDVPHSRPRVGEKSSPPVRSTNDAFEPLTDEQLADWGL
ncbi:MAG: type II toxin-antitoxin system prevent-host-death family antitoxin [Planctomycetes bacterium]|nr:type II toxin-antitoxin system prevent-host-death family antitoxin [Planctomycetota bacterium]